jgi:hypothetical protein
VPEVIEQLPTIIQEMCPFVKVGSRYVTKRFVLFVREMMAATGNIASTMRIIQAQHTEAYHRAEYSYYLINHAASADPNQGGFKWIPPKFSAFDDRDKWNGFKVGEL